MAGVDLRTVQALGGWKTFSMVQRYAHLSPAHLHAAVERLIPGGVELSSNLSRPPIGRSRTRAQNAVTV
jgi:hypothetical protein